MTRTTEPGRRRHGDDTAGSSRPPRGAADAPNYHLRRAVSAVFAVGILAGAIGLIVVSTDDASSIESVGSTIDGSVGSRVSTSVGPDEAERPIHHGYDDEVLYVALYGSIDTDALGVLGEGDIATSVERAATVAAAYRGFGREVVPSFEILASTASFASGDGDYSNEASIASLEPWVDAADDAGYHVVLDLQSGREEFPSQILDFETLLLEPHVSVALDPEWRVGRIGVPRGGETGTVAGDEVNRTVDYLDALIVENDLPPKMLIVHQFADSMIMGRSTIRGTPNVQVVIHMDGFGTLRLKRDTYARVTSNLPDGVVIGWKNFYDEDSPTPTPDETMDNDPQPMFVSFQ